MIKHLAAYQTSRVYPLLTTGAVLFAISSRGSSLIYVYNVYNANYANYLIKIFPQNWPSANKAQYLPDTINQKTLQ